MFNTFIKYTLHKGSIYFIKIRISCHTSIKSLNSNAYIKEFLSQNKKFNQETRDKHLDIFITIQPKNGLTFFNVD